MNTQNQTSSNTVSLISNEDDVMIVEIRGKDFSPRNLALARDVSELVTRNYKYVYPTGDQNGVANDGETPVSGMAFVGAAPSDIDRDNVVIANNFLRLVAESGQQPDYYGLVPLGSENASKKGPSDKSMGDFLKNLTELTEEQNPVVRDAVVEAAKAADFEVMESDEVSMADLFARMMESDPNVGKLAGSAKNPPLMFVRNDIGATIKLSTSPLGGSHLKLVANNGMYRPSNGQLHVCSVTLPLARSMFEYMGRAKNVSEINRIWAVFSLFLHDDHLKMDPDEIDFFIEPETLHFYIASVKMGACFYVDPFSELVYLLDPDEGREVIKNTPAQSQERMTGFKQVKSYEMNMRRRIYLMRLAGIVRGMFDTEMSDGVMKLLAETETMV